MKFEGDIPDCITPDTPVRFKPNGRWSFPDRMGVGGYSGFVYIIRDRYMKRFYLGKKFYEGRSALSTDWKTYLSSGATMKLMLAERPEEDFDYICLEQYTFRGSVSYAETWSLVTVGAALSETWYNKRIEEVTWNVKEAPTDRHKDRLQRVIAGEKFEE